MMKRAVAVGIMIFCLLSVIYFLWMYEDIQNDYDAGDTVYEQLKDEAYPMDGSHPDSGDERSDAGSIADHGQAVKTDEVSDDAETDMDDADSAIVPDMERVSEVNDELVAWISCPGTVIDYPIAHGTDNEFYLTHLANGKKNANGSLFIDCNNAGDFSDKNTLIYGHNMHSGKMFAALLSYSDQAFFENHPYMYLTCGEKTYRLELFSAYVTESGSDAYRIKFSGGEDFADWIIGISGRSGFKTSMRIKTTDRIVTLSTCAYDFAGARFVVHGRLKEI